MADGQTPAGAASGCWKRKRDEGWPFGCFWWWPWGVSTGGCGGPAPPRGACCAKRPLVCSTAAKGPCYPRMRVFREQPSPAGRSRGRGWVFRAKQGQFPVPRLQDSHDFRNRAGRKAKARDPARALTGPAGRGALGLQPSDETGAGGAAGAGGAMSTAAGLSSRSSTWPAFSIRRSRRPRPRVRRWGATATGPS